MPLRPDTGFTNAEPLVPKARPEVDTSVSSVLGAAAEQGNDILNLWEYVTRPEFPADPNFDTYKATKNSPFWAEHRDAFVGAHSQQQWDYIAQKIEKENKDRQTLSAAGAGGYAALLFMGALSPTMLIPAATPLRGARGILSAMALGAGAAGLQEIPLQLNQETRTSGDIVGALAAGTILGGLIGTGVHFLRGEKAPGQIFDNVEKAFEKDMAATRGGEAIPTNEMRLHPEDTPPTALRLSEAPVRETVNLAPGEPINIKAKAENQVPAFVRFQEGVHTPEQNVQTNFDNLLTGASLQEVKKSLELPSITPAPKVIEAARKAGYDGIKYGPEDTPTYVPIDNPEPKVIQLGPLIRTPAVSPEAAVRDAEPSNIQASSIGAASAQTPSTGGLKSGGKVMSALAQLSPVARTIAQSEFPKLRQMMSKLSTNGLRLEGNADFIPAQVGGTVEANVHTYDAFIGKLVKAVDEHYTDYFYHGETKPAFPAQRAALHSTFRFTGDKLTRDEFNAEVFRAMNEGDIHPIEQVAKTAHIMREEILDPILEEAKSVGIFDENPELADPSYIARMYDQAKIDADTEGFVQKLTDHYSKLLKNEVAKASDRLKEQRRIYKDYVEDVNVSDAEVEARREDFQAKLDALGESDEETQISALRREKRSLKGNRSLEATNRVEAIDQEVKALKERAAPQITNKREYRRRLRNLGRSFVATEEKRAKKLEKIGEVEDSALNSLKSVLSKGRKLERDLNKLSDRELKKQLGLLNERLHRAYDANGKRLARLEKAAQDGDMKVFNDYLELRGDLIDRTSERITAYTNRFNDVQDLMDNREVLRELLHDLSLDANRGVNALNLRRGERIGRLRAAVEKLTPEKVAMKLESAGTKMAQREADFNERFRAMGIDDINVDNGSAVVDEVARQRAQDTVGRIQKYNNKVSGLHVIGEERGSELARVLTIPTSEIYNYVITDIERVIRNYVRQTSADIELKRAFGDVDAKQAFKEAEEEFFTKQKALKDSGASAKEQAKSAKRYRDYTRNLTASIARLRHTYGIPENPTGFAARAGKIMLDLSTLRYMGGVAISSFPDVGWIIMRHGLQRTFGTGFNALVRDLKTFKGASRELKLAGEALDPIIHSRAMAFADLLDEYVGNTIPERAIHTLANKIGVIAGFDYWTSGVKQLNGVLSINKIIDSLDLVVHGKGTPKEVAEATEFLAEHGYNKELALRTWDQIQDGGGNKVNGLWLPNTEDWGDKELVRTFRAALNQDSRNAIITPGLELPLTVNSSTAMRLLFQFKSFALSSHTKMLMAGLQRRDMAILHGALFSLALGALAYYTKAQLQGGQMKTEMENASAGKWMDEAIAYSGLTAAFGELQRIGERIPLTAPYVNFSGTRNFQRSGDNLTSALLGPGFDTLGTATNILTGIDDPTQSTVHQARTMLPLQNVFWLKRLFDLVEDGVKEHVPETRDSSKKLKFAQ